MARRTNVSLFMVKFTGLFGRNRSVKRSYSNPVEAPDFSGIPEGLREDAVHRWAREQAQAYAAQTKAKHGDLRTVRIDGCEPTASKENAIMKFRQKSKQFPARRWSLKGARQKFREDRHAIEARDEARQHNHVALVSV